VEASQAPVAPWVTRTLPVHVSAGGVLQVMPVQPAPRHAPFRQPSGQGMSVDATLQVPPVQVPAVKTRRVAAVAQVGAGAAEQSTPAQVSSRQCPSAQPRAQATSLASYPHAPSAQLPALAHTWSVEASRQEAGGGVLQTMPAQGSPVQAPLAQPVAQVVSRRRVSQHHETLSVTSVNASRQVGAAGVQVTSQAPASDAPGPPSASLHTWPAGQANLKPPEGAVGTQARQSRVPSARDLGVMPLGRRPAETVARFRAAS
jgi:hypothetical protein